MKIIDVRTKEEFDEMHIDGAININVQDLAKGKLPETAKDAKILVYCASGGRSEFAKHILESAGFSNVTNGGGYFAVKAMGIKGE